MRKIFHKTWWIRCAVKSKQQGDDCRWFDIEQLASASSQATETRQPSGGKISSPARRAGAALTLRNTFPKLQAVPTVLRIGPYRFHFYSREGSEPPHIHVAREDMEAKFWLRPVALATNRGFATAELSRIQRLVDEHCQALMSAYIARHGN